jgi:tetratricopeptide (TPR) repeat protein
MNSIGRSLDIVIRTTASLMAMVMVPISIAPSAFASAEPSQIIAQAPPKEFDLKDFEYWATQCRSLFAEQLYPESLAACEKAIPLTPEKDRKAQQKKTLDLWKVRSEALVNLGRYPDALTSYDYVLTIQPAYSQGLTKRCDILLRLGRFDAAISSCEQALKVDGDWGTSNPADAWALRANALRKAGKLEEAMGSYDQAIVVNPDDRTIAAERCETIFALKKSQETASTTAQAALQKATPGSVEATLARTQLEDTQRVLSSAAEDGKKCTLALEKPEKPEGLAPQKPTALLLFKQGLVFQSQGRTGDARRMFQESVLTYEQELAANPTNPQGWVYQGMALEQLRQDARALTAYEQAIQLQPNSSFALVNQCGILNRMKRFQDALTACDNALKGDRAWGERNPEYAWSQRSGALLGTKKYEDAVAAADRAIALNANNAEAYTYKAVSFWYLKDYAEAETAARQATVLNPNYPQAYAIFGKILSTQKRYAAAVAQYSQALNSYNQAIAAGLIARNLSFETELNTNLAAALWHSGKANKAFPLAQQLAENNPQSFEAQYNYGLIALDAKFYSKALQAFQAADMLKSNTITVMTGQGLALKGMGRLREALIAFNSALSINPNFERARTAHDETFQLLRQQLKQQILRQRK